MMNTELIQKYNIPGPRYTSYPTVPFWDEEGIELEDWKSTTVRAFKESNDKEGKREEWCFMIVNPRLVFTV